MSEPIVVVGAGGFGREVLDVIDAINATAPTWDVLGVADDAPDQCNLDRLAARDVLYLGTVDEMIGGGKVISYVVGIGSPAARRRVASRLDSGGFTAVTLVHPTVTQGFGVTLGKGSIVCAGTSLTTNIAIGRHVHINPRVTIGHDTTVGDFVSLNPGAAISGDCTIEAGVLVGVAGVVLNQLTVGENATVGGSACVVRSVPPGAVVKGVPAR